MYQVEDIELVQTCEISPEQYDAFIGTNQVGYLRLRWGLFEVYYPNDDGDVIYEKEFPYIGGPTPNYGYFENDERETQLMAAKSAIIDKVNNDANIN